MSTFVIGAVTATFSASIRGWTQEAGDLEKLNLTVTMDDAAAWAALESLVTTKYAIQVPLSGDAIVDVARGAGVGTLTIGGLGTVDALLVSLNRNEFLRNGRTRAPAQFLITGDWS
jgi:hypothetical protein